MKLYRAQSIFDAIYLLAFSKEYQQTTSSSFYHNSITQTHPSHKPYPPTFITLKYFRIKHDAIRNKYIYNAAYIHHAMYKLNGR